MEKRPEKKVKILPRHLHLTSTPMGVFRWRCNPPQSLTFDDLLDSAAWDNVNDKFSVNQEHHQGQIVEILDAGLQWYAEVIIFRLRNGQLSIKKLHHHDLKQEQPSLSESDYDVKLRGSRKWSIVRNRDQHVIKELMSTREEAFQELEKMLGKTEESNAA